MSRRFVKKLITMSLPAAAGTLLVLMAATEIWVRANWNRHNGMPGFFLTDAVRGQRLAANYDGWFAGVPVNINSLELRDPREYPLAKQPNTFRILVLGDSVTFGHGSLYEHTYPYLVEKKLKTWRPEIDWQVWNAAVPGYNTSQELAQLLEVGERFQPDLVVVGFFDNDLIANQPLARPGVVRRAAAHVFSAARRHVASLELYKRIYLTIAWRVSGSSEYRKRLEHVATEESLLQTADADARPEQAFTPFERLTDAQVRAVKCLYGMKPDATIVPAMQREPGYGAWLSAVRTLQELNRTGRYRIVFFVNHTPPVCPDEDVFYDGGTRAIDDFYLHILDAGTPAVSTYDAFLHVRPSQMPAASEHAIGNSNAVKADVLFEFLRDRIFPGRLPAVAEDDRSHS